MKSEEVGVIAKNRSEKEIVERWKVLGLLEGLNDSEKKTCAMYYEKMAEALIKFSNIKYEFDTAAFSIIRRLVKCGYKFDNFNPKEIYTIYCNEYEKIADPKYDKVAKASVETCDHFAKTKNTPKIK